MTITRPALRYHGGKWVLAPWIISHFPQHECYVEPFGGAASVLLTKAPSPIEVYNDLDSEVVNFFRVLRSQADALVRAVALTPYSREEMTAAYDDRAECDDLERARRFFTLAWQSRGANRGQWKTGWRYMRHVTLRGQTPNDDWRDVERLYEIAARWRDVTVEHDDALKVIARFDAPSTLFYCDPPYTSGSRSERWGTKAYQHEMTDDDHRALAAMLHQIHGTAVLSGYPSSLYTELYGDWERFDRTTNTDGKAGRPGRAVESLWLSPRATAGGKQGTMAL